MGRETRGSTDRSTASPVGSEADSDAESGSSDLRDDKAYQEEVKEASGRRPRRASSHRESAWIDLEGTPVKPKFRRKASCSVS